jgi:hypothetical protein
MMAWVYHAQKNQREAIDFPKKPIFSAELLPLSKTRTRRSVFLLTSKKRQTRVRTAVGKSRASF